VWTELKLDNSPRWMIDNLLPSKVPRIVRFVRKVRLTDYFTSSYPFNRVKPDRLL